MKLSIASVAFLISSVSGFVFNNPGSVKSQTTTQLFERKPFITGNWKLNPNTKAEAMALAQDIVKNVKDSSPGDVALFVPFPFIETVQSICGDKISIGAEVSYTWFQACKLDIGYFPMMPPPTCI